MRKLILLLWLLLPLLAYGQSCPQGTAYPDGCPGSSTGTIEYPNLQDTKAVLAVAILSGSGYTNGTYSWTSSGGGCSVAAAGTITVSGGLLGGTGGINYTLSNEGSGCTSRPTIAIPSGASGGSGGSITATVHQVRVPWNAAGVDYYVGVPSTVSLQDPTTATLPSGATFSGHTVTVSGTNVTLNGFDFTLHDTSLSVTASSGTTTVNNSKFVIGSNQNGGQIITWSGNGSLAILNSECDGSAPPASGGSGFAPTGCLFSNTGTGGLTLEYDYCHDIDSKCFQVSGSPSVGTPRIITEKYNLFTNIGTCTGGGCAHGEAEYTYGSGYIQFVNQYNTYYDNFWNSGSNATSISAIQADNLIINGNAVDHNIWISPGPGTPCSNSNANAYVGAANQFDGSQNDPSTAALNDVTFGYNYMDGSGVYFNWYHATKSGSTNSNLIYANNVDLGAGGLCNQISGTIASKPVASPGGGSYSSTQTVSLSNPSGTPVRCWNTNTSPVTDQVSGCAVGTVYTGPITVSSTETLYWTAGGTTFQDSPVGSATYTISATQASPPSCSPGSGTYTANQTVTCTNPNSGTTVICYSTSTTPATNGLGTDCTTGTKYTGTLSITGNTTLNVIAGTSTLTDSSVVTYSYVLQGGAPVCSPVGGTYIGTQSVALSQPQSLAIGYTTNGTSPVSNGSGGCSGSCTLYSGAISVASSETIKSIGMASGWTDSSIASCAYVINAPAATDMTMKGVTSSQGVTIVQ